MDTGERGAVMVESAIALPIFFFIIFVGADLIRVAYNAVGVQFLAARSLRSAVLTDNTDGTTRAAAIKSEILRIGRRFGINLDPGGVHICVGINPNCSPDDAGNPDDLITVTIEHRVPTIVGLALPRAFTLTGQVVGRNEYYFD